MPEPPACLPTDEFARAIAAPGLPPIIVLTADRDVPLWRDDSVPTVLRPQLDPTWHPTLTVAAQPGEFHVFQLGIVPVAGELRNLEIGFALMSGAQDTIPATAFRCPTLSGTLPNGQPLHKSISVARGVVQPVWIGVDIPNAAHGLYRGELTIRRAEGAPISVPLIIDVGGAVVAEHGTAGVSRDCAG